MTRTGVMASSRPRTAAAATSGSKSFGSSRVRWIFLAALVVVALALVPTAAMAAEPTSSYTTTTPKPTTTSTTPSSGALPSKESEKPASTTPASEAAPSSTSTTPKASTLPFTGFDLRWDIGFGMLLVLAGASIIAVQRRQRRGDGR
jgi:hypothetical protein